jgi:lipoate-protein ligase A
MVKIINETQIVNEIKEAFKVKKGLVIVDYQNMQVNYGFDEKPNFEYCLQNNIPCVDIGRRGGAFVINKGDIGAGYIQEGLDNTFGWNLTKKFVEFLREKGFNAEEKNNDVLIDGYKVFGRASHFYKEENCIFITCHFTMSVDLDLINKVCTKPMNKIPKGLNDFGIGREEIIQFINDLLD